MSKILTFITAKVLPNILLILITGATASVGIYTATKVSDPQTGVLSKNIKEIVLGNSTKNKKNDNTTIATNTKQNLCLVKISGNTYNVYDLKKTHSGGDVFICDSDMTNQYISQHGTDLTRMNQYLYTGDTKLSLTDSKQNTKVVTTKSNASSSVYNKISLGSHNNSKSCYVAYNGTVYNVTNNAQWASCRHHGITGGIDISSLFPHPTSYLSNLPIVGKYADTTSGAQPSPVKNDDVDEHEEDDEKDEIDEKDEDHEENEQENEQEKEFEVED